MLDIDSKNIFRGRWRSLFGGQMHAIWLDVFLGLVGCWHRKRAENEGLSGWGWFDDSEQGCGQTGSGWGGGDGGITGTLARATGELHGVIVIFPFPAYTSFLTPLGGVDGLKATTPALDSSSSVVSFSGNASPESLTNATNTSFILSIFLSSNVFLQTPTTLWANTAGSLTCVSAHILTSSPMAERGGVKAILSLLAELAPSSIATNDSGEVLVVFKGYD